MIKEIEAFLGSLDKVVVKARVSGGAKFDLHQFSERLNQLAEKADPILQPPFIFDPGDPAMIGRVTSCALLVQAKHPLSDLKAVKFYGSGIYSIYYKGDFPPYRPIRGTETPIYVGKADPQNPSAATPRAQGTKLFDRLGEHLRSIDRAENLEVSDFEYRYLVVKSGMQKSAEEYLINYFRPIWNNEIKVCFGIGKHGDSGNTRSNKRSPWDVMHPGRPWAAHPDLLDQKNLECIIGGISNHLQEHPPLAQVDYKSVLMGMTPP